MKCGAGAMYIRISEIIALKIPLAPLLQGVSHAGVILRNFTLLCLCYSVSY